MLLGILVHADTGIGYGHGDFSLALAQNYGNLPAGRREPDGVGEKIRPDVFCQLLIAVVIHPVQITLHRQSLFQPVPLLLADAPAQLFIQAVYGLAGHDLCVFILRQLQNVGAHGSEPFRLLYDRVRVGLPLLGRQVIVLQQLGKPSDGDKGRFEFVGEGVHKVHPQQRHAGQLLRHLVEAADVLRHLAPSTPHFYPHGVIAGGHRLRSLHQPRQRRQIPPENEHGQQNAQNGTDRQDKDGPQQRIVRFIQMHQLLYQGKYTQSQYNVHRHQSQHQKEHRAQQTDRRLLFLYVSFPHFRPPGVFPYSRSRGWSAARNPDHPGIYPADGRCRPPRCVRPHHCPDPIYRR